MFVNIFSQEEQIKRGKEYIQTWLESKGIRIIDPTCMKHFITKTPGDDTWYYPDVSVVSFVINLQGDGIRILTENGVETLPVGHGCLLVGDQGYTMCGLKPTLCSRPRSTNSHMLTILVEPRENILEILAGDCVIPCPSGSEEDKKSHAELKALYDQDMARVNA